MERHHHKGEEESKDKEAEIQVMSQEEVRNITQTKHFDDFISKASRMILRGLNTEADVIGHFDRLEFN